MLRRSRFVLVVAGVLHRGRACVQGDHARDHRRRRESGPIQIARDGWWRWLVRDDLTRVKPKL